MTNPTPEQIKSARLSRGLLQREAAALIHMTGRGVDSWSEWETGKRPMPVDKWELFLLKIK